MSENNGPGGLTAHMFEVLLDAARDFAIFMLGPDGVIRSWNEGAHRMKGYIEEEAVGHHFRMLYVPEDQEAGRPERNLEIARNEGRVEDIGRRRRKSGQVFEARIIIRPAYDDGQLIGFTKVVEDLTNRRRQERRERQILEQLPIGLAIAESPSGRLIYANSEAERLLGHPLRTSNDVSSYRQYGALHPDGRPFAPEEYPLVRTVLNGEQIREEQMLYRRGDGTITTLDVDASTVQIDGEVVAAVSTFRDIERQKRAEAALRESEQRLRVVVDGARDHTIIVMDEQRRITLWSCGAEEITGWNEREVLGESADIIFTPPDIARGAPVKEQTTAESNGRAVDERWHIRKDGTLFWGSGVLTAIRDEKDRTVGYVKVFQDATSRKEHAERLEELVRERTRDLSEKNRELEGFTYAISHDMRAPLRGIVAHSRMVLEDFGLDIDPDARNHLQRLSQSAMKLAELVDDLLEYARLGSKEIRRDPVDFSELAREVVASVQRERPDADLQAEIQPNLTAVGDRRILITILHNLVDNACKYRKPDQPARIEIGFADGAMFIRDQGIGFDMAYKEKVFAPFGRLHRDEDVPGTGIGLANVQRGVERHGGRVWTEASPGQGATFFFTLGAIDAA